MSQYSRYPVPFGPLPIYPSAAFLPANEVDGFTAIVADTDTIYAYNAGTMTWLAVATPGAAIAIDGLTGDVTATGPGVVPATISAHAVTNSKLAQMPNNTVKGNKSGGTADPQDLALSDVTEAVSSVLTISNGTKSIVQASNLSIQVKQASTIQDGYLSSTDFNTFNGKLTSPLTTKGDILAFSTTNDRFPISGVNGRILTEDSTQPFGFRWVTPTAVGIVSLNGDSTAAQTLTTGTSGTDFAIVDNGTGDHKFNLPIASASNTGKLSNTDWSTFNSKQPAGNYITALTGDVTASGPGSAAATLADTAVTPGSYGSGSAIPSFTVDSKGRLTAASTNAISGSSITHSTLSGLTTGDAGHTQFAMLAGRAGGQTLNGGTAAVEDLLLVSTVNATKGDIFLGVASTVTGIRITDDNRLLIGADFLGIADMSVSRDKDLASNLYIGEIILPTISDSVGGGTYYGLAVQPISAGANNPDLIGALFAVSGESDGTGGNVIGLELSAEYTGLGTIDGVQGAVFSCNASNDSVVTQILSARVQEPGYNVGSVRVGLRLDGSWSQTRDDVEDSGNIDALDVQSAYIKLTQTAVVLRGIANGLDGKRVLVQFANGATISNNNANPAAGNKIRTMTGADITITGRGYAEFIYDSSDTIWDCIFATA